MRIRQLPSRDHTEESQASHDRLREARLAYEEAQKTLREARKDCQKKKDEADRLWDEYLAAEKSLC